ncbi:MAG: Mini-ribonuclease 3 [Lachnospiraceae bacterium]|jgi:ribonuclease-3 family protein|nr:Mini-ribonuclease 3 [Lachnospiraceae bacterium]
MQEISKTKQEVNIMSPLVWAYVGDSVYELYVRTHLTQTTNYKPHKLHIEAIKFVKAKAQSDILNKIYEHLTDEEKEIVRRARNTENHHLPKNADVKDYMYSTAYEGLIGYLYLTNNKERLYEILEMSVSA